MRALKFIHAADLHLDSPFKGVNSLPQAIRDRIRESTFTALSRLVNIAVQEAVDFVLVSGDVYDLSDRSLRAQLRFLQAAERLAEHGIRLFVIHGNHDPLSGARAKLNWPDLVHTFGSRQVETVTVSNRAGEPIATVSGISYEQSATTDNLAAQFPSPDPNLYAIAMLHTNVDGDEGHDNYAPCSREQLLRAGYDYWALGHVHNRRVLSESPHIVYPGNIQGRSARETGAKGCYLVEVDEQGHATLSFRRTDTIEWTHQTVSIQGWSKEYELKEGLEQAMQRSQQEAEGSPVMLRLSLTGRGSLHQLLHNGAMLSELIDELRELGQAHENFVWIASCKLETGAELPLELLFEQESLVGDLLRMSDDLLADEARLLTFCREACAPLLGHAKAARLLQDMDPALWKQQLLQARELAAEELLGEGVIDQS